MARYYKKKPSEILNISDEYLAFCFDEVCFYYDSETLQDDGTNMWDLITWSDERENPNKKFIEHIKSINGKGS